MANEAIYELTGKTSLAAANRFIVQDTAATTRATSATFALMGGLEVTTGSDADTTMAVGTLYRVDMSAWATAVRTYRLPSTAQVGERIAIYITAGNATHELAIRTVAASNDTINGVDYDSADWSKLFITGEIVIFECVVADTDWIVIHDGRIPCKAKVEQQTAQTGIVTSTHTVVNWDTSIFDYGGIASLSDERYVIRRNGEYLLTGIVFLANISDGTRAHLRTIKNGSSASLRMGFNSMAQAGGQIQGINGAVTATLVDGDYVQATIWHNEGSNVSVSYSAGDVVSSYGITELL